VGEWILDRTSEQLSYAVPFKLDAVIDL